MTTHELEKRLVVAEDQWRRWKRIASVYGSGMCLLGAVAVFEVLFGICR